MLAAGLAALQLLPATMFGIDRRLIGVPLLIASAALGLGAYPQWRRADRALRQGRPLPSSFMPSVAAVLVGLVALAAAVMGVLR